MMKPFVFIRFKKKSLQFRVRDMSELIWGYAYSYR